MDEIKAVSGILTDLAVTMHEAADNTNDSYDHDEYHAAGTILELIGGVSFDSRYLSRWIDGLYRRAYGDD